jgi:hypothetical protein
MEVVNWDADRVLDRLTDVFRDLYSGQAIAVDEHAVVLLAVTDVLADTSDSHQLLEYAKSKAVTEHRAPIDERTAKTLAGCVAIHLNRERTPLPAG